MHPPLQVLVNDALSFGLMNVAVLVSVRRLCAELGEDSVYWMRVPLTPSTSSPLPFTWPWPLPA